MGRSVLLQTITIFYLISTVFAQELWVGKDGNIRNVDSRAMVIDDGGIYLATRKELYRALDAKSKWEEMFSMPSGGNEITCMSGNSKNLFIGTKRGLFRAQGGSRNWRNVFMTILPDKNNILCIEVSKYNKSEVLIGTEKGIFISEDLGANWQDISYNLKNRRVTCIGMSKDTIYAASSDGLYSRKIDAMGWERIYVREASSEERAEEETRDFIEAEDADGSVNCIAFKGSRIYAGVDKNILYSDDGGKAWIGFSRAGLTGSINYILPSRKPEKLYCATTKGVFEFDKDKAKWLELYKGMDKTYSVRSLLFDNENEGSIWAVTEGGLYRLESGRFTSDQFIDVERNIKGLKIIFDNEPTIRELQQAAIMFNEVGPEKIKKWRSESKARALLPKVSFGIDRNSTDLWHWEGGSTVKENDDVLRPGRDSIDWDATLIWELGDLIWSDDQTNIDVRSRLTTQLRNDILDDLRRVYFERKRLQFEIMANPPKDMKTRFDKELRIQELTQSIDDLTGNYLSDHIKRTNDLS
ncbi:MAG: hypothetical protein V1927_00750 [Candidatus Omnitrophota bacterium]